MFSEEASGKAWKRASDAFGEERYVLEPSVSQDKRSEGEAKLLSVVRSLSTEHLDRLLRYLRDWNTQSKHNLFAQQVR